MFPSLDSANDFRANVDSAALCVSVIARVPATAQTEGGGVDVLLARNVVTGAAFAFPAAKRSLVLPIPPSWIHDAWIAMLIAATGKILADPEPAFCYRVHGGNQIGVASRAAVDRLAMARQMPRREYADERDRMALLRERVAGVRGVRQAVLARIDEKIAHADARATMAEDRPRRIPAVLRELVSGRYARYSSGWYSALSDLALR